MAVFRVEKTKDYTVMANHHLKNQTLSLKAKGLLSLMLSLPDTWDYTLRGLSVICKDGVDGIRTAVKELEEQGYIKRRRIRNEKGQLITIEYMIYEYPNREGMPIKEGREMGNPVQALPKQEKPAQVLPIQLNTKVSNTQKQNTSSINMDSIDAIRSRFCEKLDTCTLQKKLGKRRLDQIIELLSETVFLASHQEYFSIGKYEYPAKLVLERLTSLDCSHLEYILECMEKQNQPIRNIREYWLTALFRAPVTIDAYYDSEVRCENSDFL
ncbi:DUF6017 domain-containing protein [Zhenpiania hominis]|uniref:Helix-turn-helix domain-containing protein n=1 Tax=Zhenpiania hominis TaxID=2763644 RepID=A0A923NIA5_9FIRM|nr:DUF6017 domain-containing protein [Zhenpiania hominis]MBC6679546.1 helix-turn-helix domain-containing protein [Zhenpiania hominis]